MNTINYNHKLKFLTIAVTSALLTACGGGGSGGSTANNINLETPNTIEHQQQTIPVHQQPVYENQQEQPVHVNKQEQPIHIENNVFNKSEQDIRNINKENKSKHISQQNVNAETTFRKEQSKDGGTGTGIVLSDIEFSLNDKNIKRYTNGKDIVPTFVDNDGNIRPLNGKDDTHGGHTGATILSEANDVTIQPSNIGYFSVAAAVHHLLENKSVTSKTNIVNMSFGDKNDFNPVFSVEEWGYSVKKIENLPNSLFIKAAGNGKGAKNPESSSEAMAVNDKVKDQTILTAAYNLDEGHLNGNSCGKWANTCISVPDELKSEIRPNIYYGSSIAAARLSGSAAKIASEYSWATPQQIRDIILTTATKKVGEEATYGVGIFNESAAMRGYGSFNKDVTLNVNGNKNIYYFGNNINGQGSLTKKGNSILALTGDNTYTGKTTIQQGGLLLNGQNTSDMDIASQGTLIVGDKTNGVISSGSINNKGTLSSESLGDLIVKGDFNSTGVINKYIGSTIYVDGKAQLSGTLNITGVADNYVTKKGTKETLLSANNVSGNFDKVNVKDSSLIGTTVQNDSKGVYATVSRNTIGAAILKEGLYAQPTIAAKEMDSVLQHIDHKIDNNIDLNVKEKSLIQAFAKTNNVSSATLAHGTETQMNLQKNMLIKGVEDDHNLISKTKEHEKVWFDTTYDDTHYTNNALTTKSSIKGISFGASVKLNDRQSLGISANQQNYHLTENVQNVQKTVKADTLGFKLAYIWRGNRQSPNFYGTFGFDNIKMNNGKGSQYLLGLGLNKEIALSDKVVFIPDVGLFFNTNIMRNVKISDLNETEKMNFKSLSARLGLDFKYKINPNWNVYSGVNVQSDIYNSNRTMGKIAGIDFNQFVNPQKDVKGEAKIGVQGVLKNGFSITGAVSYQKAKHWNNKQIQVGVNYQF